MQVDFSIIVPLFIVLIFFWWLNNRAFKIRDLDKEIMLFSTRGGRVNRRRIKIRALRMFISCAIENIFFNIIIFLIWFALNPFRADFQSLNIHPLLVLVSLMALRYGNYLGILSAFIASMTFTYAYFLLGRDMILLFVAWDNFKFFLMFFSAAIVLGTHKDKLMYIIDRLNEKLKLAAQNEENAVNEKEKYRLINEQIKSQIFNTEESLLALYDMASALENVKTEELYTEIMILMTAILNAKVVSIYTVDNVNGFLRLKIRMGSLPYDHASIRIDDFDYLRKVVYNQEIIKLDTNSKEHDPIFSAPIVKDGIVFAVVNLEKTDFDMVTLYSYNKFKLTIKWISKALFRAIEMDEISNVDRFHEGTKFLKSSFFEDRFRIEKNRKNKFGVDHIVLRFGRSGFSLQHLNDEIVKLVRQVDVLGYNEETDEISILFPVAAPSDLDKLKRRLSGKLDIDLR